MTPRTEAKAPSTQEAAARARDWVDRLIEHGEWITFPVEAERQPTPIKPRREAARPARAATRKRMVK